MLTEPTIGDNANRALLKINQLYFNMAGTANPDLAPSQGDTATVSLRKINALVFGGAGSGGGGGGGVPEAPTDGQLYGRKSSTWAVVPAGGGGYTGPGTKLSTFIDVRDRYAPGTAAITFSVSDPTPFVTYVCYLKSVTIRTSQYGAPPTGAKFKIQLYTGSWVDVSAFTDVSSIGTDTQKMVQIPLLPVAQQICLDRTASNPTWAIVGDTDPGSGAMLIVSEWGLVS